MRKRHLTALRFILLFACLCLAAAAKPLHATEYFVNKRGDDANDGLSRERAFQTIQKGVDALQPGDTLTILPGEYFESVKREHLGGPERETVIRAEVPGTVLLRGDVPAPTFRKTEGRRYVYEAEFDRDVLAVNEVDTLTIMETAPNVTELEHTPGAYVHDAARKRLYLSTSDLQPPDMHHYTVSVTNNYGLFLYRPVRVVVEGLAASGYHPAGINLVSARDCVVRQCAAFLNGRGIVVDSGVFKRYAVNDEGLPVYSSLDRAATNGPGGNMIAECRAYGNYSRWGGGNIIVYNSREDVIRDCVSFGSVGHGIRHYGAIRGPAAIRDSLEWGNELGIDIKGGDHSHGLAERCVSLSGLFNVAHVSHNLTARENRYNSEPGLDNVRYDLEAAATRDREFADPANLDFRLQGDSQFRGTGPDGSDRGPFAYAANIYYVKPDGNDQADGLSMTRAWKTLARAVKDLRPGDTLYLAGGTYQAGIELRLGQDGGERVSLRGRGADAVIIQGAVRVMNSHNLTFERLSVSDAVTLADSRRIAFDNCRFMGTDVALAAKAAAGLRITHGVFTGFEQAALDLTGCSDVYLSGNIFDNRQGPALRLDQAACVIYSDYNAYRGVKAAWAVKGTDVEWDSLPQRPDRYSRALAPAFRLEGGIPVLENAGRFSAGGPLGMPLGHYRAYREQPVRVSPPVVHSLTPTTANVEWMTSRPARCEIAWGDAPDATNRFSFNAEGFGSVSLTGLQPNTTYSLTVADVQELSSRGGLFSHVILPPDSVSDAPDGRGRMDSVVFTTPGALADPVVYYVAPDGSDAHDGLSRQTAFRSITRAADLANAGDTVMIAGGTYSEIVRVRATGLPDRPITFTSVPGERAILDGDNLLARAFVLSGKHHIHFDGLYFRDYNPDNRTSGIFRLYRSDGVRIRRCFYDGRRGYSPSFVMAYGCADLAVRNCAILSAFYGNLYLVKCPDALIENNALIRSLIQQCVFVNEPDQKIRLRKNIVTDNVPHKVMVALVEVASPASLVEADNAFYFRVPPSERKAFMFYDPVAYGRTVESYGLKPVDDAQLADRLAQITLAEYQQESGDATSLAVNPGFAATADMPETDQDGGPVFLVDRLLGKKDLDFPDLFATRPEVVERGIGLQPEAFQDFHFNARENAR